MFVNYHKFAPPARLFHHPAAPVVPPSFPPVATLPSYYLEEVIFSLTPHWEPYVGSGMASPRRTSERFARWGHGGSNSSLPKMIIRICHKRASERLNLNNPRQTECSLGIDSQSHPCVSERRDFYSSVLCG